MSEPQSPQFNSVLLPNLPATQMRSFVLRDGTRAGTWDLSIVPFLIEALIAQSATRVAVQAGSLAHHMIDGMPRSLQNRTQIVDKDGVAREQARSVLAPVFRDFDLRSEGVAFVSTAPSGKLVDGTDDVLGLFSMLETFLVGARHRLQVELDPARVLNAIAKVRDVADEPESRACLAALEGVFSTYEVVHTPALEISSSASAELAEIFARFVEDETYSRLGREAGLLGIPTLATHGVLRMRRSVADLLRKPKVADVAELGGRSVAVASRSPLPSPQRLAQALSTPHWMPPLVSLAATRGRASAAWEKASPRVQVLPELRSEFEGATPEPGASGS